MKWNKENNDWRQEANWDTITMVLFPLLFTLYSFSSTDYIVAEAWNLNQSPDKDAIQIELWD